jgi:hypothetical protein
VHPPLAASTLSTTHAESYAIFDAPQAILIDWLFLSSWYISRLPLPGMRTLFASSGSVKDATAFAVGPEHSFDESVGAREVPRQWSSHVASVGATLGMPCCTTLCSLPLKSALQRLVYLMGWHGVLSTQIAARRA